MLTLKQQQKYVKALRKLVKLTMISKGIDRVFSMWVCPSTGLVIVEVYNNDTDGPARFAVGHFGDNGFCGMSFDEIARVIFYSGGIL